MRLTPILLAAAVAATAALAPARAAASAIDTDAPGRETRASATEYIILLFGGAPPTPQGGGGSDTTDRHPRPTPAPEAPTPKG